MTHIGKTTFNARACGVSSKNVFTNSPKIDPPPPPFKRLFSRLRWQGACKKFLFTTTMEVHYEQD
ncbi:MAG: hypothetical protein LBC87_06130 [Fibromonadaceae bacterium]|nr:hypothetical protein [Fibromonadaceae bacterium]